MISIQAVLVLLLLLVHLFAYKMRFLDRVPPKSLAFICRGYFGSLCIRSHPA